MNMVSHMSEVYNVLKQNNNYVTLSRSKNFDVSDNSWHGYGIKEQVNVDFAFVEKNIIDFTKISSDLYDYYFKQRLFYNKVSIDLFGVYIFGILLAAYINQGLKNGEISELDYEYCKYEFSNLSLKDICNVLNLDLSFNDGFEISDSSIKKLEKNYKLEVGKYIEK